MARRYRRGMRARKIMRHTKRHATLMASPVVKSKRKV